MILTCPECKTRYLLNPAQLRPDGRIVRCAKCGAAWKENAPAPDPNEAAPAGDTSNSGDFAPAAENYERPTRVRPMRAGSNLPALQQTTKKYELLGWVALVAFVSLVLGGGYVFRSAVVTLWPPATKLYVTLDIDTAPPQSPPARTPAPAPAPKPVANEAEGLQFKGLNATPRYEGNVLVLTFAGTIENPTGDAILPTLITAVAKDDKGADLKTWTFTIDPHIIPGHGSTTFSTELRDAPPETRRIIPTFAAQK